MFLQNRWSLQRAIVAVVRLEDAVGGTSSVARRFILDDATGERVCSHTQIKKKTAGRNVVGRAASRVRNEGQMLTPYPQVGVMRAQFGACVCVGVLVFTNTAVVASCTPVAQRPACEMSRGGGVWKESRQRDSRSRVPGQASATENKKRRSATESI